MNLNRYSNTKTDIKILFISKHEGLLLESGNVTGVCTNKLFDTDFPYINWNFSFSLMYLLKWTFVIRTTYK